METKKHKIIVHIAKDFKDAEEWDLKYWQKQTPQMRLSALVAIRNDIKKVNPQLLYKDK